MNLENIYELRISSPNKLRTPRKERSLVSSSYVCSIIPACLSSQKRGAGIPLLPSLSFPLACPRKSGERESIALIPVIPAKAGIHCKKNLLLKLPNNAK